MVAKSKNLVIHVNIVTYNHEKTIAGAVQSVLQQQGFTVGKDLFLNVLDNCSSDESAKVILNKFSEHVNFKQNKKNTGFCLAHNALITQSLAQEADYILVLNPDLRLDPLALQNMLRVLRLDSMAGAACPKLFRADQSLQPVNPPRLDSAGMYITPALRHFDRGSEQADGPEYNKHQYVFGASGAAVLLKRQFIFDASLRVDQETGNLELFDPAFFAYREDADLAWRAQWLGWKCRYVPNALGYHVRLVLPERRTHLPKSINAHSVRNRFLLQIHHVSIGANLKCLVPASWRNFLVLAAACSIELSSFPAIFQVITGFRKALTNRRSVLRRARANPRSLTRWFQNQPYCQPALSFVPTKTKIKTIRTAVINYNSGPRLEKCLQSLAESMTSLSPEINLLVSVVDNASQDGSVRKILPLFESLPGFEFILSQKNLGFAGGINSASAANDFDALLILNPDSQVSASAIRTLATTLDSCAEIGLATPALQGLDGRVQHGFNARSFPTIASTLAELFFLHRIWPHNPWTSQYRMTNNKLLRNYLERKFVADNVPQLALDSPVIVDQPAGACMLIRKTALVELGGFDSNFWPAWFEDVDFAKRIANAGYLAVVAANAKIVHEGGYSTESLPAGRFSEIWYPNMLFYWKKHGRKTQYWTLRILLPVALLLRAVVSFSRYLYAKLLGRSNQRCSADACSLVRLALAPKKKQSQS